MTGDERRVDPIVFCCEDSLWQMLKSGEKPFDMRRWDLSDNRIYRLAWGHWDKGGGGRLPDWLPDETLVSFLNKATGEVLTFCYRGMEFTAWAPGWVFLLLGGIVGYGGKVSASQWGYDV